MPPDMRRPPSVDLTCWVDEVDRRLSRQVRPRRRARLTWPDTVDRLVRLARTLARPVAHGSMTLVAAVVVVVGVAPLAEERGTVVGRTMVGETVAVDAPGISAAAPLPRPAIPPLHRLLPPEDRAAAVVVLDIQKAREELTGTPHGEDRAVPTPDGGGSARAALRPTVR